MSNCIGQGYRRESCAFMKCRIPDSRHSVNVLIVFNGFWDNNITSVIRIIIVRDIDRFFSTALDVVVDAIDLKSVGTSCKSSC